MWGANGNNIQSRIPECPVITCYERNNILLKSLSRFVSSSSAGSPRSTSAARDTLCVETADPGSSPVQPAGESWLGGVTDLKISCRPSTSTEEIFYQNNVCLFNIQVWSNLFFTGLYINITQDIMINIVEYYIFVFCSTETSPASNGGDVGRTWVRSWEYLDLWSENM